MVPTRSHLHKVGIGGDLTRDFPDNLLLAAIMGPFVGSITIPAIDMHLLGSPEGIVANVKPVVSLRRLRNRWRGP